MAGDLPKKTYLQPLLVYTCYLSLSKTYFVWTERVSEKHLKIKDFDINYQY